MAAMGDFLENKLIDHLFRAQSYPAPTTLYLALFTSATTDAGGGTEVTGGSYARMALTTALSLFLGTHGTATGASSGTGGQTSNAADITWAVAPSANWGTVTHFAILAANTGMDVLFHGALATQKTINNGDPAPKFLAGDLVLTLA